MTPDAALARFRRFYEEFSPAWLDRLEELYAPAFQLRDPFHTFVGDFAGLRAYLRSLESLAHSQFHVEDIASGGDGHYVRWHWEWRRKKRDPMRRVAGVTHLRLDDAGKITHHRDLFDGAEVYETIPVLGGLLRAVKKRI